jgi:hypothetical protein
VNKTGRGPTMKRDGGRAGMESRITHLHLDTIVETIEARINDEGRGKRRGHPSSGSPL